MANCKNASSPPEFSMNSEDLRATQGTSEETPRSGMFLVVRIARPTSLAIWHRRRSHRRPNRSGSPNRRHFASLDLKKKTPRFFASQANIAAFSQAVFLAFSCDFRSSECVFASLAKNLFRIASDLGVCDSNRIAHRGCIARFGPLRACFFCQFWR